MSRVETCSPDPERVDLLLGGSGSETRKGLRRPPSRVGWGRWDARSAWQRTLAAMPPTPPSDQAPASGLRIARHYSSEAQAYRDLWAPVLVGLARWLVEELPLAETRRVLDLGCGVGALLPHLDRVAPRALVVGLDRAEGMVALGPRDFPLLVGDAAELPFAAGSFDAVVMAFMLFHLPRPTAGLAEAWRVLRPGGSVGLLTWGTERESRARRQWVEELDAAGAGEVTEKLSWHELVNTPQKVNGELQAAGFTVAVSRVESFVERPTCAEFVSRRTSLGCCGHRWASLEQERQQALLGNACRRLEELTPEDFEEESEVIITVAQRRE
jgi:SAM-dependent methyltransferase